MTTPPNLQALTEEERHARLRLARYRAKLYSAPHASPMAAARRLAELDRSWRVAATRLQRARGNR